MKISLFVALLGAMASLVSAETGGAKPVDLEGIRAFICTPQKKVESDPQGTQEYALSAKQVADYTLRIDKQGPTYIWTSREKKRLINRHSGAFNIFYPDDGSGYIKLFQMSDQIMYMEHLHMMLNTITYWGVCQLVN